MEGRPGAAHEREQVVPGVPGESRHFHPLVGQPQGVQFPFDPREALPVGHTRRILAGDADEIPGEVEDRLPVLRKGLLQNLPPLHGEPPRAWAPRAPLVPRRRGRPCGCSVEPAEFSALTAVSPPLCAMATASGKGILSSSTRYARRQALARFPLTQWASTPFFRSMPFMAPRKASNSSSREPVGHGAVEVRQAMPSTAHALRGGKGRGLGVGQEVEDGVDSHLGEPRQGLVGQDPARVEAGAQFVDLGGVPGSPGRRAGPGAGAPPGQPASG